MEQYPDYRANEERDMYQYYKSLDYSKIKDYTVLFSNHNEFINALTQQNHPFHKEAMQIRANRQEKKVIELVDTNGEITLLRTI